LGKPPVSFCPKNNSKIIGYNIDIYKIYVYISTMINTKTNETMRTLNDKEFKTRGTIIEKMINTMGENKATEVLENEDSLSIINALAAALTK